jgi:hypothetical protein
MARCTRSHFAAKPSRDQEVPVRPRNASSRLHQVHQVPQRLEPDCLRAHGNNDEPDVDEVELATQLFRNRFLEVEEAERDVVGKGGGGQELLGRDVVAGEGVSWWRDGGEVFEPDAGSGADICYAGICGERRRDGGVEEVANAPKKSQ